MTPARIAELRALCEAASEGPWRADTLTENRMNPNSPVFECVSNRHGQVLFRAHLVSYRREPDAAFTAAARTALPEALSDLEAAHADIEQLTARRDVADAYNVKLFAALQHALSAMVMNIQEEYVGADIEFCLENFPLTFKPVVDALRGIEDAALSGEPGK